MTAAKILGLTLISAAGACAQLRSGAWAATVHVNDVDIPFRIELKIDGLQAQATFFNGAERFPSTSGTFANGTLAVKWEYFAATLTATYKDGVLEGVYDRARSKPYPFHAELARPLEAVKAPSIDGLWEIHGVKSSKGEQAVRL